MKMEPTGPETSVINYQSTLCNIPEEQRSDTVPVNIMAVETAFEICNHLYLTSKTAKYTKKM
jgi:hypothetical protein